MDGGVPASYLDLEKARRQERIVKMTAAQVQKDFGSFGIEIHFSGDAATAYEELNEQLTRHIDQLLQIYPVRLKSLLYQVDVNERMTDKALPGEQSYASWLAGKILDREFVKVLTRIYFSEQSGNSNLPDTSR